jgi:hypothetical protein
MAGTVSDPIFVKDGQYLSYTGSGDIALGKVVKLIAADKVEIAAAGDRGFGVALAGNRFSRTATDASVADGQKVTVVTRGVVNVYTDTSAITVGSLVKAGAAGTVAVTTGTGDEAPKVMGIALEANNSAAATIMIKLLRG